MKALKWIGGLMLSLIILGSLLPKGPPPAWDAYVKYSAEDGVKDRLRDPDSAEFKNVFVRSLDENTRAVCGLINAKNGFGGRVGFTPFLVIFKKSGDQALRSPALLASESIGGGVSADVSAGAIQLACFGNPQPPAAPPAPASKIEEKGIPNTAALNNTLERLRALQRQQQTERAAPAPMGNGDNPKGLSDRLSSSQLSAIGERIRECWSKDAGALDLEKMQAKLLVTVGADGVAREAMIAPEDRGRLNDPRFRVFAERAVRAALNPRCATLPIPKGLIGSVGIVRVTFRP
ncbi:conserved protein of unknown function (plasmid) [Rhodovastum atsumiense]|uniref:Energy transducer TonB n=1 Tax=Rhodovastum atsumiense TaxID=504468 RepID=A0A5M6INX3_9PROT|nr:hypothetical protein [Rhodovastum atsumiense]KAA5609609.1 hypothetical protein F1189_23580 [Rhodovastum atsumiense]CAH2606379.1 conserved protein of unknown function [Rhodovastum atsumiense]